MYDVIIIGAGPAGYVSAIRAAQVGMKVLVIEKKYLGGMCLNWGCMTTKSLIESAKVYQRTRNAGIFGIDGIDKKKISFNWEKAVKRSETVVKKLTSGIGYLFKKNEIELIMGEAVITSPTTVSVDNRSIEAKNIIIATGSYPAKNENVKCTEIEELLTMKELPEEITLIGKGGTAIEIAQLFSMIDKKVKFIVPDEEILPDIDKFLKDFIIKKMKADGIQLIVNSEQATGNGQKATDKGLIVNCNARAAIIPKSNITIDKTENGFIKTNDKFQTNHPEIYAIGDVNGKSYLAHVASAQGIYIINNLKGIENSFNLELYPFNLYTNPEMAQIGVTEQKLIADKVDYKVSTFPLTANGRALTEDATEGQIRMLSDKKYGEVLGVQIIAQNATDLIAEASAYMQLEGTIYDVAQTIHAHPTVSEIFLEAGFDAVDKAINK